MAVSDGEVVKRTSKRPPMTDEDIAVRMANKDAVLKKSMRKCHDCGNPTYNYRCYNCLRKWQEKNKVSTSVKYATDFDW